MVCTPSDTHRYVGHSGLIGDSMWCVQVLSPNIHYTAMDLEVL